MVRIPNVCRHKLYRICEVHSAYSHVDIYSCNREVSLHNKCYYNFVCEYTSLHRHCVIICILLSPHLSVFLLVIAVVSKVMSN